jgi:hypothetical protein
VQWNFTLPLHRIFHLLLHVSAELSSAKEKRFINAVIGKWGFNVLNEIVGYQLLLQGWIACIANSTTLPSWIRKETPGYS